MPKLHLLFNHNLTDKQRKDATKSFHIDEFVSLPDDLQQLWINIPADLKSLNCYLNPIETYLKDSVKSGDYVLIQGDFGATCKMVGFAKQLGAIPVYATTKRDVIEVKEGNAVIKKSVFQHKMFRRYE